MHNDVLKTLNQINKVLLQEMSLERDAIEEYQDNESDILSQTFNYHKGKDDAFFYISCLINRMMAEELLNGINEEETITAFRNDE